MIQTKLDYEPKTNHFLNHRPTLLFIVLSAFFVSNALVAEFVGVKIFAFEDTVGINPLNWNLFGHSGSLSLSAGVLLWPVVFIMTDLINEYYGKKGVKLLSYIGVGMISYAFLMIYAAIQFVPADFWLTDFQEQGVPNTQSAFAVIFGQGAWIIVASIIAFLVGQVLDAAIFHKLRKWTNNGKVWLRATGSTVISQFIDSFLVLYIAFVLGPPQWDLSLFFAVGTVNYTYKFLVAVVLTPVIYLMHNVIDNYLGKDVAEAMKQRAIAEG